MKKIGTAKVMEAVKSKSKSTSMHTRYCWQETGTNHHILNLSI